MINIDISHLLNRKNLFQKIYASALTVEMIGNTHTESYF